MDQNSQNIVLTNNSRTAWPTQILMLFLRSLDNFIDAYYFSNRNDREGWLAVDNQTFFFFFFFFALWIKTVKILFWSTQEQL